jgi:hypothetical protein
MRIKPAHGEDTDRKSGKLKDRIAIITGADSGIGKAVTIAFAREGADVAISFLNEQEDASDTTAFVEDAGRTALLIAGDISEEAHCKAIVQQTVQKFGRVDVLVNNAAFQMTRQSLDEIPSDEWDRTFRTNIYSMFYLVKAAVTHMRPGSAVVNTTSVNLDNRSPLCWHTPLRTVLSKTSQQGWLNYSRTRAFARTVLPLDVQVNEFRGQQSPSICWSCDEKIPIKVVGWNPVYAAIRDCSGAWHETEFPHNGKRVRHDGVFEDFSVTNGVDVDRHPLEAIARAGTSVELPAMRTTEAINEYDLVAFRDYVEHLASRVGNRLIEHLVELSPSTGSDLGAVRREG